MKEGFQGQIFATRLTCQLMSVMLRDSAFIQESDAEWQNQKGAGRPPVEPLYTVADAEAALQQLFPAEYGQVLDLCDGVRIRFRAAGHLLGSSMVEIWATEETSPKAGLFRRPGQHRPAHHPQSGVSGRGRLCGHGVHLRRPEPRDPGELCGVPGPAHRQHLCPGATSSSLFAVGALRELLYFLREIKHQGLVKSFPSFQVCVDSPLAAEATRIYAGDLRGYLDEEAIAVLQEEKICSPSPA